MRNINRAAERAVALGVALRPHIKTHKCAEIGALQLRRGAAGITASTLAEAAAFADFGCFDDITLAIPLAPDHVAPALDLAREVTLRLLVDDLATFETLERAADFRCQPAHVWLKIDCGLHRAGLDPDSAAAVELAGRMASSESVTFDGLLTHAGHAYGTVGDPQARSRIAAEERDAVVGLAARLRDQGIDVPRISVGSTPTFTTVDHLEGVTEARPGNYSLFDLTQVALGSCTVEEIAVSVLATVVSHPPGSDRAVVDAGALALSKDAGPGGRDSPWGGVCPDPAAPAIDDSLRLARLTQEHGVILPGPGADLTGRLPVGARVRILPNHACLTVACFDELSVVDGHEVIERWPVLRRRSPTAPEDADA